MDTPEAKDYEVQEGKLGKVILYVKDGQIESKNVFATPRQRNKVVENGYQDVFKHKVRLGVQNTVKSNEVLHSKVITLDEDEITFDNRNVDFIDLSNDDEVVEEITDESDVEFVGTVEPKKPEFIKVGEVQSFETIFLPAVHEDVPETSFFDYNSYKRKHSLTEDVVNVKSGNFERNISNAHIIKQPIQFTEEIYENGSIINYKSSAENKESGTSPYYYIQTEYLLSQEDKIEESDTVPDQEPPYYEYSNYKGYSYRHNKYKGTNNSSSQHNRRKETTQDVPFGINKKPAEEASKYTCPFCKRCKEFDSLVAVNNHLKFEHLAVIKDGKDKFKKAVGSW